MIRLVHITDPHLTALGDEALWRLRGKRRSGYLSWYRHRRYVHLRERLDRVTEAVHREGPVQILVTGDLVHIGLAAEFEVAAEWLDTLGSPEQVVLVPGNHDDYAADSLPAMRTSWARYLPSLAEEDAFPSLRTIESDGAVVSIVGLSSAGPTPLFMAHGALGAPQLARADRMLAHAEGFRCVLVHHPPQRTAASWRKRLRDADALERLLDRHQVELVLHGHVHDNTVSRTAGGVRVFGTASASGTEPSAAYRRIDVERVEAGWRVDARLISVAADGRCAEIGRDVWTAPLRTSATTPADASRSPD